MARETLKTKLAQIRSVTPTMRELTLQLAASHELNFKTGQFMMLHVPQGAEKPALRAYSIASDQRIKDHFKLILKLVEGGVSSEFVRGLKGGEALEFTGPFGKCFFKTPPPERVLFLCTGAGLSQHFSMLASEASNFPQTEFILRIGVWNESELFYEAELNALKGQIANFKFEFVLDQASPSWKGKKGYVTDELKSMNLDAKPTHIYLCGNPAMINGAKQILLEELKVPKENVIIESFG